VARIESQLAALSAVWCETAAPCHDYAKRLAARAMRAARAAAGATDSAGRSGPLPGRGGPAGPSGSGTVAHAARLKAAGTILCTDRFAVDGSRVFHKYCG
jgi:hypothetical protein